MVEAAAPIDPAGYPLGMERTREHMCDPGVFIYHVDDGYSAEFTGVEGLATRSRIEGGPIEVNPSTVGGTLH
jgi:hypothetical protein